MSEDLLAYYNRELAFLRRMGAEFAKEHPKVAGRLRLSADTVEDPHVARMIESAAFLNARVRHKLEDDFPEISDALLSVLYPHYLAPIPSMAIVQMQPLPDLTANHVVPAGSMLQTDRAHGEPCRYRTCYPTTLHPFGLTSARLQGAPFDAPRTQVSGNAAAVLALEFRGLSPEVKLQEVAPGTLRLHLGGQTQHAYALYEAILNDVAEIVVATSANDRDFVRLPANAVRPVGFRMDEGLLPYPDRSLPGYRLLTEYFAFPHKFLFVDIEGIEPAALARAQRSFSVFLFLRRSSVELQKNVGLDNFLLGCTPVVNLFGKRAEPIRLTGKDSEVRIVPDARKPQSVEVYSVDSVAVAHADGKRTAFRPFYGIEHGESEAHYYHAARRPAELISTRLDRGTEVFLQFVDLQFGPMPSNDAVLMVETTCLNRDLPSGLPFGGDQPRMASVEGLGPVERIRCLTAPTPTLRPRFGDGARWRLLSHLSLNHLSLTGGEDAVAALREILRLYDFAETESNRAVVESLLRVDTRFTTLRVPSGHQFGFCRGIDATLELDASRFADHGLYLFASVLEAFLGGYCSMNSFVRTAVTTPGRETVIHRWPPRAGTGPIL